MADDKSVAHIISIYRGQYLIGKEMIYTYNVGGWTAFQWATYLASLKYKSDPEIKTGVQPAKVKRDG